MCWKGGIDIPSFDNDCFLNVTYISIGYFLLFYK
jgi:hypothetical protein